MSTQRLFPTKVLRRGVIAVQVAITLTALTGVVAIVADGGIMLAERRHAQATADAAALAAATDLFKNWNTAQGVDSGGSGAGTASKSAIDTANSNGYKNDAIIVNGTSGGGTSTVTVQLYPNNYLGSNYPPYPSTTQQIAPQVPKGYAQVSVTYYQRRYFSGIFGSTTIPIKAQAAARGTWGPASTAGLILLNPSASPALDVHGNGGVTVSNGGIIVDSSDSDAIDSNGNGFAKGTYINVTGNVNNKNGGIQASPGSLTTGVTSTSDPLASLPTPSIGSLTAGTSSSVSNGGKKSGSTWTLTPGIYNPLPSFGSNDTIIFQQASVNSNNGIYYLQSGGLQLSGQVVQLGGGTGGLMFYNPATTSNDDFDVSVDPSSTPLTPLTSGIYQGISYFQNRSSTTNIKLTGNGSTTYTMTGTYYAVGANFSLEGNGNAYFGSQLIINTLTLAGNGNITVGYNAGGVAPARFVSLVQ